MSILKSERKESRTQYIYHYTKLYNYTVERAAQVSNRKVDFLVTPLADKMNNIYRLLRSIEFYYDKNRHRLASRRYKWLKNAIDYLCQLEFYLYIFWLGMTEDKTIRLKQREYWVKLVNDNINFIHSAMKRSSCYNEKEDNNVKHITYFSQDDFQKTRFLSKMYELFKMILSVSSRISKAQSGFYVRILFDCISRALYLGVKGNMIFPKNKDEYEARKDYFTRCINNLKSMNEPLIQSFIVTQANEDTVEKAATLLHESISMLVGVMKSDESRFSKFN